MREGTKVSGPYQGKAHRHSEIRCGNAGERLAKAELAREIRYIVKDKNWTRRRAADVLGIAPPDVSDLTRGKLARFTQERLERFLNSLHGSGRTVADLVSENRD